MNIFQTAWADIEAFFKGKVGLTITEYGAGVAGAVSAYAAIEKINPSNTVGTAKDVQTLCTVLLTMLNGTSAPTQAQMSQVFANFKANAATQGWETLAAQLAATLSSYIQAYSGTPWMQVATWYIDGWLFVAGMLGGATTAAQTTNTTATPATN